MAQYLSDDEVFGTGAAAPSAGPVYLSDEEVFGATPASPKDDSFFSMERAKGVLSSLANAVPFVGADDGKPNPFAEYVKGAAERARGNLPVLEDGKLKPAEPKKFKSVLETQPWPDTVPSDDELIRLSRRDYAKAQEDEARRIRTGGHEMRATKPAPVLSAAEAGAKRFAEDNPVTASIKSSAAQSLAGLANAPSAAAQAGNEMVRNAMIGFGADVPASRVPNMPLVDDLMKMSGAYTSELQRRAPGEAWDRGEFGQWLLTQLGGNSMNTIQSLGALMVPGMQGALLTSMGATAAGTSYATGDSGIASIGKGVVEAASEKLPLEAAGFATKKVSSLIEKIPAASRNAILQDAGRRLVAAGGAVTFNSLVGAIEESAAQIGGNAIDIAIDGKTKSLFDEVDRAAIVGAAANTSMAAPAIIEAARRPTTDAGRLAGELADALNGGQFAQAGIDQTVSDMLRTVGTSDNIAPTSTSMAAAAGERARLEQMRAPKPTVADIGKAASVDEAIATAEQSVASDVPPSVQPAQAAQVPAGTGRAVQLDEADLLKRAMAGIGIPQDAAPLAPAQAAPVVAPEAATPAAQDQPVRTWFGRRGDGYATPEDAQRGLSERQRLQKDLQWRIEQTPEGRYRLAGYAAPVGGTQALQTPSPKAEAAMPKPLPAARSASQGQDIILQNRDRNTPASIDQMQSIAANPDYLRAGPSRTLDQGAPVAFGAMPPSAVQGRAETVADGRGQRIQTQYAVVEAADLLASNQADGTPLPEYATGESGRLRVVAGNGRTAGLQAAYLRGTAAQYREELQQDAQSLGIDPQAVAAMREPVLIRVMDEADVTPDIADRSNIQAGAEMSAVERANNDARRIHVSDMEFHDNGTPTEASLLRFIQSMPVSERGGLVDDKGPTQQAIDRVMAVAFKQAYGGDELVRLFAQATDPESRVVIGALARIAGRMAQLDGAAAFDIRVAVADAAGMAITAKRRGKKLADIVLQGDLDLSPEAVVVARFMADNIRSGQRIADGLLAWVDLALDQVRIVEQNASSTGMFGEEPTLSRQQLFERLGKNGDTATAIEEPATQRGGAVAAGEGAERREAEPAGDGRGAEDGAGGRGAETEGSGQQVERAPSVGQDLLGDKPNISQQQAADERARRAGQDQQRRNAAPAPEEFALGMEDARTGSEVDPNQQELLAPLDENDQASRTTTRAQQVARNVAEAVDKGQPGPAQRMKLLRDEAQRLDATADGQGQLPDLQATNRQAADMLREAAAESEAQAWEDAGLRFSRTKKSDGGSLRYLDTKTAPQIWQRAGALFPRQIADLRSRTKILTEKNLAGYRRANDPQYSFAGQQAATADTMALATAQERLESGEDAETIRKETGWHKGADGKWRFEISDADAVLMADTSGSEGRRSIGQMFRLFDYEDMGGLTVGRMLHHPALFAAYPEIANIRVEMAADVTGAGYRGGYSVANGRITINRDLSWREAMSTLLHEIQHGIQEVEGFATGSNPSRETDVSEFSEESRKHMQQLVHVDELAREHQVKPTIFVELAGYPDNVVATVKRWAEVGQWESNIAAIKRDLLTAREKYRRSAGEAEARNTQARQKMTDEERRATPPSSTADVADSDVIVTFNGKEMHNAPTPANATPARPSESPLVSAWTALAGQGDISRSPVSRASDLPQVFSEVAPGFVVEGQSPTSEMDAAWKIYPEGKPDAHGFVLAYKDGRVELNVPRLSEGDGGAQAYVATGNWALNTGRRFAADRYGLSSLGAARRLENLASMAVKFGTAEFMDMGGNKLGVQWTDNDQQNMENLLRAAYDRVRQAVPDIDKVAYDFEIQQFVPTAQDAGGIRQSDALIAALVDQARAAGLPVGRATIARAILTGTFIRGEGLPAALREAGNAAVAKNLSGVLYGRDAQPRKSGSTVSTITDAIRQAYGPVLPQLQANGLVTLVQSQDEAIEAAAKARADKTGESLETVRERLMASVRNSIAVWHGSPHRGIEKTGFKLNKIGSGEGAQAYGWGMYFASLRGVAEHYQKALEYNDDDTQDLAESFIDRADGSERQAARDLRHAAANESSAELKQRHLDAADWIDAGKKKKNPSQLYSLNLPVEESDLLDWDRPLSEQSQNVRDAMIPVARMLYPRKDIYSDDDLLSRTGEFIYKGLSGYRNGGPKAASSRLQAAGIPGLRYLDGNSRSNGNGSHNYVIWDEALMTPEAAGIEAKFSKNGAIQGFFDPQTGQSFLIADGLTEAAAPGVLAHEVGIHMAADTSSDKGKAAFDKITARAGQLLKLGRGNPFFDRVNQRMLDAQETSNEEAAAYIAEEYERDRVNAPASVKRWVTDFMAAVRAWLFGKGVLVKASDLGAADIAAIARANVRQLAKGGQAQGRDGAVQRSDASPTEDEVRALMRQYADVAGAPSEAQMRAAVQDYRETERAYGGKPAYDKARAAGKTKLTYGQWVQTRTGHFKNWFGDWQALAAQQRLYSMEPLKVRVPDAWRGLDHTQLRQKLAEELDRMVREKVEINHPELGEIRVGRVWAKKTTGSARDPAKALVAADIEALIPDAVYARSEAPRGSDGPDIAGYSTLLARVDVDGAPLIAAFTVRHQSDGQWYYNAVALHDAQEKAQDSYERPDQQAGSSVAPIAGLSDFVRRPLARVNPDSVSKVVDAEMGEPAVVFHGTHGDFSEFNAQDRVSTDSGMLGSGHYFTPDPKRAGGWYASRRDRETGEALAGGNVMPMFLNARKPLEIRLQAGQDLQAVLVGMSRDMGLERMPSMSNDEANAKWAPLFTQALRERGHDGVRLVLSNGVTQEVSVFDGASAKSATGNIGTFDGEKGDIRFSYATKATQGSTYTLPEERFGGLRRKMQDYFIRALEVQNAVAQQGGAVDEQTDFYRAEELSSGRRAALVQDFGNNVVNPLMERAAALGVDLQELALYAYAKHAQERNEYIATINDRLPDGGSGMTTADADAILDKVRQEGREQDFEELHQGLMDITASTRALQLSEGLITQDEFDAMQAQYQNYIPLRGFEQVDEDGKTTGRSPGKGFNIRGQENLRALGRSSRAGDLIENAIHDYIRTVDRGERNQVGKVFLNFVLQNPDASLWEVDAERTRAAMDRQTGKVKGVTSIDKGEDTIAVKVAGREVYVRIHDPLLLRAMRKSHTDDRGDNERLVVRALGLYTALLRNTLTRYNPEFALTNALRDYGFGMAAMVDELGEKGAAKFTKHYAGAVAASHRNESNTADPQSREWDKYFTEFRLAGGMTAGFYVKNTEEIGKDIRTIMLKAGAEPKNKTEALLASSPARAIAAAGRVLGYAGSVSENAARVAAYRTAREMGKSPSEAASIAKNLTTNFDRKGELGQVINAAYVFYNAAVQGSHRLLKMLANPKVAGYMAGFGVAGLALALANADWGGDDPDDGMAYWDKIPAYEKERNLIIMLPPSWRFEDAQRVGTDGHYVKIPLQYGLNLPVAYGYAIADVLRNHRDKSRGMSPVKAGVTMASYLAGAFNPFGGSVDLSSGSSMAQAALPSLGDAVVQFATGTNGFGRDVAPFKSPFDTKPDSENYNLRQADSVSLKIAQLLNRATGGSAAEAGGIDISAGTVENLIRNVSGGTGAFLYDVGNLAWKSVDRATGGDPDIFVREMPLARRVYGELGGDVDQGIFYESRKKTQEAAGIVKRSGELDMEPSEENQTLASMDKFANKATRDLAKLRREMIRVKQDDSLSNAEKTKELRELRAARDQITAGFNQAFTEVMREFFAEQK